MAIVLRFSRSFVTLGLGMCAAVGAGGCFLVADANRFEVSDTADDPNAPSSLIVTVRGMHAHQNQRVELRVIDAQNILQCRAVSQGLGPNAETGVTFNLPLAIPAGSGPYRFDFFSDMNGSGDYDGIPGAPTNDHAWRIAPLVDYPANTFTHVPNLVQIDFQHNTQFIDIDQFPIGTNAPPTSPVADAALHFLNASLVADEGHLIEVRIVQKAAPFRTVGLFRNAVIPVATDFEVTLSGIVENAETYDLDVYLDANGNGAYDNPATGAGDKGWRFPVTAAQSGALALDFHFDPTSGPSNVDVGAP